MRFTQWLRSMYVFIASLITVGFVAIPSLHASEPSDKSPKRNVPSYFSTGEKVTGKVFASRPYLLYFPGGNETPREREMIQANRTAISLAREAVIQEIEEKCVESFGYVKSFSLRARLAPDASNDFILSGEGICTNYPPYQDND